MPLREGLTGCVDHPVSPADTAVEMGSGDVPVLGTPRVVALMEQASLAALAGELEPGQTTVGWRLTLQHRAAVAVGATVTATARLLRPEGRQLTFAVAVHEGQVEVADGRLVRVVVDRARFLTRTGMPT